VLFPRHHPGDGYLPAVSVEQIEQQIQQLPPGEVIRLAEWFNGFLAAHVAAPGCADSCWEETPELISELNRRLSDFAANPAIAVPFEPDYFDSLNRQLADERAPKASAR
jgi:hypothetical protein